MLRSLLRDLPLRVVGLVLAAALPGAVLAAPAAKESQRFDALVQGVVLPPVLADLVATLGAPIEAPEAPAATWVVERCFDSGPGTLRDILPQVASGDVVELRSCTFNAQTPIIIPQDNLTITGRAGEFPQIWGGYASQVLNHTGKGTLTLRDMGVRRGRNYAASGAAHGGCIASAGSVRLVRVRMGQCVAESASGEAAGGAIYAKGGVTLGADSEIIESEAIAHNRTARGGAIAADGMVDLTGALLRGNVADAGTDGVGRGGAIDGKSFVGQSAEIYGNAVRGKRARGGAVHAEAAIAGALRIQGNEALEGGGLYIEDAAIVSGVFTSNRAATGGAIHAAALRIANSRVATNKASGEAGGIHATGALTISGTEFYANEAAERHAAVRALGDTTIEGSGFLFNDAPRGAAVSLGGLATQRIEIAQSSFYNNRTVHGGLGTAVELLQDARIRNSTIAMNSTTGETATGIGIMLGADVVLELSSSVVSKNWDSTITTTTLPVRPAPPSSARTTTSCAPMA